MDVMNMYTLEFFSTEDDAIDAVMDFLMEHYPELKFDVYKENISEQLQ